MPKTSHRAKITCCNCNRKRKEAGYNLCKKCFDKFKSGEIQHPHGFLPPSAKTGQNLQPVSTVRPDSDKATLCDHNPFDVPFYVNVQPADPERDPLEWWEAA